MRLTIASLLTLGGLAFAQTPPAPDPLKPLVDKLDLERYKATIKGLTQFGDRRQGTDRNRAAVDWIEAQLKSYGCQNTERIKYEYQPPATPAGGRGGRGPARAGVRLRGDRARTGVNNDPEKQPDQTLRTLNTPPSVAGTREEVFCTKVGSTHPEEMYIVSAHMDGIGWGEAANDDGSGTALVMELARILNSPGVETDRSIRFALWNNEESGTQGAQAYALQRKELQGLQNPPGSGKYPEPRWLGVIQHDMMLFDHGMPRKDGTLSKDQRTEADVNIEFQATSKLAAESSALAWAIHGANEKYATDYPASVGPHMNNTDSTRFQDLAPSVSLREHERSSQIGAGWDPHWHQPTDLFANFTDADFRLGLNAAQSTLGAVAQLAGAKMHPLCLTLPDPCPLPHWTSQESGVTVSLRGVSAVSDSIVWASGAEGTWLRTSDGGKRWESGKVTGGESLDFRAIQAFSGKEAIAMSIGEGTLSKVFATRDGGAHWTILFTNPDPKGFFDGIAFRDTQHGVLFGDPVGGKFAVFVTVDGGRRWTRRIGPDANPGEASFAASNSTLRIRGDQIWIASGGLGGARVFNSPDNGKTWSVAQTPVRHDSESAGIFSLSLLDDKRVFVVGGDYKKDKESAATSAISIDAGKTWTAPSGPTGFRSAIEYLKPTKLWIATGTSGSDVSADGATWYPFDSNAFNALSGVWAVGPKGRIAKISY